MATKAEAKEAVLAIAKRYGYVNEEIWNKLNEWDPEVRHEIQEIMLALIGLAAHSIRTLARNIYGSGARFVFELLQNADDNKFTKALAKGDDPFISFHVHPDRIIVECNEDGFTLDNIEALCAVGKSTKSASYGYIGAKGIDSSLFSSLRGKSTYNPTTFLSTLSTNEAMSVLGWCYRFELHKQGDPKEVENLQRMIFEQLNDLQQTCLLFLRNLRDIRVAFYNSDGSPTSSKTFRAGMDKNPVYLEVRKGDERPKKTYYHITRHMATGLPKSDNRELPDTEEARDMYTRAEVVLAFPLTAASTPIIERQGIFAFLPLKESHFNFLIHSDFDPDASREHIVTTSRRNFALREHIAEAFIQAVLEFCEHPELCYTWPRYLPSPDSVPGDFWAGFVEHLKRLLSRTPIVRSRHLKTLRKLDDIVTLSGDFKDEYGSPLLDDPLMDPFLSNCYTLMDSNVHLKPYGLKNLYMGLALRLIEADLDKLFPKARSGSVSEEWHSAVAKLLTTAIKNKHNIRGYKVLPLATGTWVSANSGRIYLPTTKGLSIPSGVHPRVLSQSAVSNSFRRALFVQLHAAEPTQAEVRRWIVSKHKLSTTFSFGNPGVTRADSKAHLHYLYQSHDTKSTPDELQHIKIFSSKTQVVHVDPHEQDVYFSGTHAYGPEALLSKDDGAPGLEVQYLHHTYLEDVPSPNPHLSWKRWLQDFIGVRERLRLVSRDGKSLSPIWEYVAQHRPKQLLGMLEHLWKFEEAEVKLDIAKQIKDTNANDLCALKMPCDVTLCTTYIPLPTLQKLVQRYMEKEETFPFLDLGGATVADLQSKWAFLTSFGVGNTDELYFLIDIVHWIGQARSEKVARPQRLVDLYLAIDAKRMHSLTAKEDGQLIRTLFEEWGLIFIPARGDLNETWAKPDMCVWEGPPSLSIKHPLKHLYTSAFGLDQLDLLARFFNQTLSVSSVSWKTLVEELEHLKVLKCNDRDQICGIYTYLDEMTITESENEELKQAFASRGLIYVPTSGQWYMTSECLWSSTTEIRGKVTLNTDFEGLRDFFIETLGVKTLTLRMVYDELLHPTTDRTIEEVKNTLWSLNALLQTDREQLDPEPLLKAAVFAVQNPNQATSLESATVEFSIADRAYLSTCFQGRISLLDYNPKDVWQLKPLFEWMRLEDRYLSVVAKQITSVDEGTGRPIPRRKRDLKRKAHALLRVAATFDSPRYNVSNPSKLYDMFRNMKVLVVDEISCITTMFQGGRKIEVKDDAGSVHISDSPNGLTIYVPKQKRAQNFCFGAPLPTRLADWLMYCPATETQKPVQSALVSALTMLLVAAGSVLKHILDHQGIVQVPVEDQCATDPDDDESDDDSDNNNSHSIALQHDSSPASRARPLPSYNAPCRPFSEPLGVSAEDTHYRELLKKIVTAARKASFPSHGSFHMSGLIKSLQSGRSDSLSGYKEFNTIRNTRSSSTRQVECNTKIGAAGELYVYELLSSLSPALPDWSLLNWQSTIRGSVKLHPDYAGVENWEGTETADLVYDDTTGAFTKLLIDSGYLDSHEWQDARPRYFLEVKSTTGPSVRPFFMSKRQFDRMQTTRISGQNKAEVEVYMVLRVFHLDDDRLGMVVYLDPEELRLNGRLSFTSDTWSVVPSTANSGRGG